MKKIIALVLVALLAATGAFAYVEQTWAADDVEDVMFDGSHVVFDARWGNTAIGVTYAAENWSIYGGANGFNFNIEDGHINTLSMGGTLGGSFRSENFKIAALVNFTGNKSSSDFSAGLAASFWKDKIRIAVPLWVSFANNEAKLTQIVPAYIKFKVGAGPLDFLRVRFRGTTLSEDVKGLTFDLDANFYNDLAANFGAETLVRLSYGTQIGVPSGVKADQKIEVYVEPYIFGYNEGNVIQIGLVPFITVGTNLRNSAFYTGDTGLEIRTEFQPVKNFRARVSVQAVNNGDWGVKWNARCAWYY